MIDRDRQRVYDAEDAAFGGTTMTDLLAWSDLQILASASVHDPWWVALGVVPPQVVPTRSDASTSTSDGRQVRIAADGRSAAVLAHELAHHLVAHLWAVATQQVEPHGPEFRAASLRTVTVVGGDLARSQLAAEWRTRRLPVAVWTWAEPGPRSPRALRDVIPVGPPDSP